MDVRFVSASSCFEKLEAQLREAGFVSSPMQPTDLALRVGSLLVWGPGAVGGDHVLPVLATKTYPDAAVDLAITLARGPLPQKPFGPIRTQQFELYLKRHGDRHESRGHDVVAVRPSGPSPSSSAFSAFPSPISPGLARPLALSCTLLVHRRSAELRSAD